MVHLSRVLELAQPKDPKTIWITTPWHVKWGNQEQIVPISFAALHAVPTARLSALAKPKKDFSGLSRLYQTRAWEEEHLPPRRTLRPSCKAGQYEHIVRLSTPKRRSTSSQEMRCECAPSSTPFRPPHKISCEHSCPIWHIDPRVKSVYVSPRLRQLASPKPLHPSFQSNKETVETYISSTAKTAQTTSRLDLLALSKKRENGMFYDRGHPERPIWLT
ncbi:testicular haploid expressed gene protein-like isoform X3 [Alosa sapidissima]|uniref:testicular haploid expressed gene protein-like isoform X3 n=1 Tax=Alosa sapidissima TaxID=34773 RepID=UPI001C0835BF|nr:testicular haploid expressed gene protein-like isoform X3 [Alosa sapidissima]